MVLSFHLRHGTLKFADYLGNFSILNYPCRKRSVKQELESAKFRARFL